ncbi:MAG: hypothetical protein JWL76_379 [Thermoleophilia bacterium]|nr:hypothetical protein [Thermoleophilia bacterium]
MSTERIDDVEAARMQSSIAEIVQLAEAELPTAAYLGNQALISHDWNVTSRKLYRMRTHAVDAKCEYLAELIELTLSQLDPDEHEGFYERHRSHDMDGRGRHD